MDDSGPTAGIIFYFVFLLIDFFLYGFGAAMQSINTVEVERRAEEDKDKKSIRLFQIISKPMQYINTVQLITTLINLLIGALHLGILRMLLQHGVELLIKSKLRPDNISGEIILFAVALFATVLLLYITLSVGVLLPKKIASRNPEKWSYSCITPLYFIIKILSPFTSLVTLSVDMLLHLFGIKDRRDEYDVTEEEIISMVNEGHEQGIIEASEAEMISNIFELADKEAQDIMTHRNNIIAIDGSTALKDAIQFILNGKNSRYPVYEENIDHIVGILHLKDAMRYHGSIKNQNISLVEVEGLLREPYFVPQTKNINELFHEMQAQKLQMVIVVDEYGQTDGLVAMEDILEEIVGNILDEYDDEVEHIEDKGNDEYIVEGKTPLEELEELLKISFEDEEFETLNGFMISRLDRIPEPDECFDVDYNGYNFKILAVQNKMIQSVLVSKLTEN